MKNRIFTEEELKEFGKSKLDRINEMIDSGDAYHAKELVKDLYDGFTFLHDGYMCWISGLLTYIYENYGIDEVQKAERRAHGLEGRIAFPPLDPNMTFRQVVEHTVHALHGHVYQPMTVEEDDEKVTITVNPCGSGGRLIQMGAYEDGLMAILKEKHEITWGNGNLPIYCTHCPVTEALEIEGTGDFRWVHPATNPDGSCGPECKYLLYKDKSDIDESYYTRIGKTKPVK